MCWNGKIKVCSVVGWISLTIDSHLLWGRGIDQWDLGMGATLSTFPPGEHAASQLAKPLLTEALLTHLNFSPSLCSFYLSVSHYLFLYFSFSFILSHPSHSESMSPYLSVEQHEFSRGLSWSSRETLRVRCGGKKSHRRGGKEKRVGAEKKNKKAEKDISTLESTT